MGTLGKPEDPKERCAHVSNLANKTVQWVDPEERSLPPSAIWKSVGQVSYGYSTNGEGRSPQSTNARFDSAMGGAVYGFPRDDDTLTALPRWW